MRRIERFKTNSGRDSFFPKWLRELSHAYTWILSKKPLQLALISEEEQRALQVDRKGLLPGCREEAKLVRLMQRPEILGFAVFHETREEIRNATPRPRR